MDLKILEDWLTKLHLDKVSSTSLKDTIMLNVNSFTYANIDLESLSFYIVVKNIGEVSIFKTVRGSIVSDMVDPSYAVSRELMCINDWNIKKACFLTFSDDKKLILKEVNTRTLRVALCSVIEPRLIRYIVMSWDSKHPTLLNVDTSPIRGMCYDSLLCYLREAYKHNVKPSIIDESIDKRLQYTIVDFDTI